MHNDLPRLSSVVRTTRRFPIRSATARSGSVVLLTSLLWLGASRPQLWAEGFRNPTVGTLGLGQSGARIAQVDDATAIQHNPANLAGLTSPQLAYEQSIVYVRSDFTAPGGASTHTVNPWKLLPNLFAAWPLSDQKWAFGLGVTTPYGLSTEWDPNGLFRYSAPHFAELMTVNFNPTVAARLTETLSFGAGVDVMWSQLTLKQFIPLGPGTDGEAQLKGNGTGVSGNAGLTWQIAPRHRLAATIRLPMDIDYGGKATLGPARGSFSSAISYPMIIGVGYGYQLTDTVNVGADFEWLQFSNFQNLPLRIGAPLNAFSQTVPEAWRDTYTAGVGGSWQFAPGWVARLSYQFFETPVPDQTFSPTIPDANQQVITMGLAYQSGHHALGLSYGADFYNRRHISTDQMPAFNGTYEFTVHLIAASYHYSF